MQIQPSKSALSAGGPADCQDQSTPEAKQQHNAACGRQQHFGTCVQPDGLNGGHLQHVYGWKANARAEHVTRAPPLEQQDVLQVFPETSLTDCT